MEIRKLLHDTAWSCLPNTLRNMLWSSSRNAPPPPPPPVKDAAASQPREASLGHEASLSYPQGLANLTAASAALHLKLVFRFGCITNAVP